jgi:hypothetical protein
MINLKIKTPMKFIKSLFALVTVCAVLGVTTASAQFYSYNSFVNGFNAVFASSATGTTGTTNWSGWGATNTDMAFGFNSYVFNGSYAATANNSYIGTNTIITGASAFGLQTNINVITDARLWPDNNSDSSTSEALFVSIAGVNNMVTNTWTLTFAPTVMVPIQVPPPSPNTANVPGYPGSGTITNEVPITTSTFSLTLTANGLTPVNCITNWPSVFLNGPAKARLVSVVMATTNTLGIFTNTTYSTTLTNGVWQLVTNTATVTNFGGIYLNAGNVGYPPFHSP